MPKLHTNLLLFLILASTAAAFSQSINENSSAILVTTSIRADNYDKELSSKTEKYLKRIQKQEFKIKKKLWRKDSVLAKRLFGNIKETYSGVRKMKISKYGFVYSSKLDSLNTSIKFLNSFPGAPADLTKNLETYKALQDKLNYADQVKKFIYARQKYLKENLLKVGMIRELKGFQKEAFYYSAHMGAIKNLWEDPSEMEEKLLQLALKYPSFQEFFQKNSLMGTLFPNRIWETGNLQGLQTSSQVRQALSQRFGSTGPALLQQNLQASQGSINGLKDKVLGITNGTIGNGSEVEIPAGFKPNSQRIKTFFQRLRIGVDFQSQKRRFSFPATSDLGLQIGYMLNDENSVGLGLSYKMGLGNGWNDIQLSHQGIGLRSFMEMKLKGSIYISGGYEQNYRSEIKSIQELKNYSSWQKSGLIGLSKKYKISNRVKGNVKLMWDFLSYYQVPITQPIVFRIGYSIK